MKLKWHITRENWKRGIIHLREKTYSQKKYSSKAVIEREDPVSQFSFYGVIGEQSFFISPVVMGLNRMAIVIAGDAKEGETEVILLLKVTIAPFIRNFTFALCLWFSVCICLALIFATQAIERYMVIAFLGIVSVFLMFWLSLISRIVKKQSALPLARLTSMFCPKNRQDMGALGNH